MKSFLYFLACCLLILLSILLAYNWLIIEVAAASSSPQIIINEIMYNPAGSDSDREWIEVINVSTSTEYIIDASWRFNDGANHQLVVIQGDEIISSGEYVIFVDDNEIFLQDYPEYQGSLVDTVMSLNNSQDTISFSLDSGQTFFATTTYQSVWGGNDNGYSLERVNFSDSFQESLNESGTPGTLNQFLIEPAATSADPFIGEVSATGTLEIIDPVDQLATATQEIIDPSSQEPTTTSPALAGEEVMESYSDQIIISEILPNPVGSDNNEEYVELFNHGSLEVNLEGWQIFDLTGNNYSVSSEDFSTTTIKAYGYFVIYRNISGIALNNSGDQIRLFQPDGNLLSEIEYTDSAEEGFSFAKTGENYFWTNLPTPGQVNIISQPAEPLSCPSPKVIYLEKESKKSDLQKNQEKTADFNEANYHGLRINEFMPNPAGSDDFEWIELYNNSSSSLNLFGLKLDDEAGGGKPYQFSATATIPAFGYLLINKDLSGISLNNNGDSVRLLSGDEQIFAEVAYEKSPEGRSYNYDEVNQEWYWSVNISPAADNVEYAEESIAAGLSEVFAEEEYPYYSIMELKELAKGEMISVAGVVISPPAVLGKNLLYIAAEENYSTGIQVYSSSHDFSAFSVGDIISVQGKISEVQGEKRINLIKDSLIELLNKIALPQIELKAIGDLTDDDVGGLIYVGGELVEQSGNNLYLDDGTGELRVYLKKDTGILKPNIEEGYFLEIKGVLSLTKSGYRLLPRFQDDINFGKILGASEEKELPEEKIIMESEDKQQKVKNILSISGGSLLLILVSLVIKLKLIK